jgi:5-oxopent-3-ene-1,2,5-tricarboxylate decarboxylase/2-hydroxyhepta-2,4-diene-1,7-dioate isomerase
MTCNCPDFEVAPYHLSGVVYAALLNHAPQLDALGDTVNQPPYKGVPRAPVLAVRPRNTLACEGDAVAIPFGADALLVGGSLGIVVGRVACRVPVASALDFVAGYVVVNDLSLPVANHYRPSVRLKARDGFCPIGHRVVPAAQVRAPDALAVTVKIDGITAWQGSTGGRVRTVGQLIADITDFMTLQPGDLVLLGVAADPPQVRPGQRVTIEIDGVGTLSNTFVAEAA